LESFVTAGLGLELSARIEDVNGLPELRIAPTCQSPGSERVCAAWHTTDGRVTICGSYDHQHSRRMKTHVLWIEWWIPLEIHHAGWWRCDPKRIRDWTRGQGTPYSQFSGVDH
jgi:hypothetical protein